MNLDELRSAQAKERRKDSLQHLRDSFYDDVAAYIGDLRAARDRRAEQVAKPFSDDDIRRMSDEVETAEEVAEALYERRVGKVVKLASFAAADMSVDADGMTTEERQLFEDLVDRIGENKSRVLDVLSGEAPPTSEADPAASQPAETADGPAPSTADGPAPSTAALGDEPPSTDEPVPRDDDEPLSPDDGDPVPPDGDHLTSTAESVDTTDSADSTDPSDVSESVDAADSPDPQRSPRRDAATDSGGDASGALADAMGGSGDGVADAFDESGDSASPEEDTTTDGGPTAVPPEPAPPGAPGVTESDDPADPTGSAGTSDSDEVGDRATVRITRDVGAIFGVDEREYDLASEDVVTLPVENADPLVQRDAAERLD